jgi:thioredoxin reductase
VDVAVVGGGLAGIGVALAASQAGLSVLVIDRSRRPGGALAGIPVGWWTDGEVSAATEIRERVAGGVVDWRSEATVVGLGREGDGAWQLDVQDRGASATVEATAVVLATGGYVTPRDHLPIDGPRPSGVMTGDFAIDALERSWLPARRVVIAGEGRYGRAIAERLTAAGVTVVEQVAVPAGLEIATRITAVRGKHRLEAVRIDDRWVAADGLVLAHALRPASFLLRGLGIGDDRPGVPMPADASGALSLPGLWATGTCVDPDVDHARSLAAGRAVGGRVAASLLAETPAAPASGREA